MFGGLKPRKVAHMKATSLLVSVLAATLACSQPASSPADLAAASPSVLVTDDMGSPHLGDTAPDFDLVDQNGAHVTLASLRGSVVVLAFVTSYCPFSQAAQPSLVEVAREYASRGVKVVAVDVKETDDAYRQYLGRMAMPFPVLRDADGAVSTSYTPAKAQPGVVDRTQVVVTSKLVIDKHGKIRFFTLLDTQHFDAKLVHLRRVLDRVAAET
jgi:peroxiredoxin